MGGTIFLTLFFSLFLAIGVGILGYGLHSLQMSKQAEGWPTVPGRIVSSEFTTNTDSDGDTTYRTKVRYSYSAMGREITGDKIAFGYSGSSSRNFHHDIYEALPPNSQVAVRFNPSKPEQAVLSFGANQSIVFLLIFGTVWTFFTLGMAAMFWLNGRGATTLLDNMVIYTTG